MDVIPDLTAPEIRERLKELESNFNVSVALHPEDHLFRFFCNQTPGVDGINRYFSSGFGDAYSVSQTLKLLLPDVSRPKVLEFAAGFGRVSRHMRWTAPDIDFRISDIHAPAVQFAREVLGLDGFKSEPLPNQVVIDPDHYDFIFALSFLSHVPDTTFADWLLLLYSALSEGGVLLFTTHGETSMKKYEHFAQLYDPEVGFGYGPESEQSDLDGETYGSMCVDFEYVVRQIRRTPAQIIRFQSASWWGHQDEWIIQKPEAL
jgi:SAM-dependent methyltransferase